ncbi:MAG: glycosyltransferase family 2 protein, partial [Pararhodobacter sp.]|nr:glycosyltransferase family 2 protein [Pararhodobacter sp.]
MSARLRPPANADQARFLAGCERRRAGLPAGLLRPSRYGRVTLVSTAKDEGPYLLDWLCWHFLAGVTDVLIFTNDCTDGTDELLDALGASGLLTRLDNPPDGDVPPHTRALARARGHPLVALSDWLLVLDADEFLVSRAPAPGIDGLIDAITGQGATEMLVTWRFFGSAGARHYAPEPVITRFQRAAPDGHAAGYGFKALFANTGAHRMQIHHPNLYAEARKAGVRRRVVNGSGRRIEADHLHWKHTPETHGYGLAQVNHYAIRSSEEFLLRRLRGDAISAHGRYDDAYFRKHDRNEIADTAAAQCAPEVAALRARLLALPGVAEAQALVTARMAARLDRLRADPAY